MRPDLLLVLCVSSVRCHPDGQLLDTPLAQLLATAAGTSALQPNAPILPLAPSNFRSKRKPQNQRHRFRPRASRPNALSGLDQSGPRDKNPPNPLLRSSNFAGFSRRPRPTPVSNRRPQTVEDIPEISPTALFEPTTISPALLLQDFFGTPEPTVVEDDHEEQQELFPSKPQELFPAKTTAVFELSNDIQNEVNTDLLLEELRSQAAAVTGALPVGVSTSRVQEIKENRIHEEEPRLRIQDIKPRQFSIEPRQFSPTLRQFSPEPKQLKPEPRQFIQESSRQLKPEPRQFIQESSRQLNQEPRQFIQESSRQLNQEPRQFIQESRRQQEPRREKPSRKVQLSSRKSSGRRREGGSRRNQVRPDPVEKLDLDILETPHFSPAPPKPIQRRKPKKLSLTKKTKKKNQKNRKNIKTLDRFKYENEDGSITWGYQNEDGSFKEETIGVDCVTHGKYGYVDPTGQVREYSYTSGVRCDPETRVQIPSVSHGLTGARGPNGHGYFDYNENKFIMADGRRVNVVVNNKHRRRG